MVERAAPPAKPVAIPGTRDHILRAARELVDEQGLGAATTRAIAMRAGCAEGTLYRYWPDKHDLLMELVRARYPDFLELMGSLPDRAGTETVRANLGEVVRRAIVFYRGIVPMVAGAVSERELLEHHRRYFHEHQTGPLKFLQALSGYLKREQRLGRIAARTRPEYAARMILGACFGQAFVEAMMGEPAVLGSDERFAREVVGGMLEGIGPEGEPPES